MARVTISDLAKWKQDGKKWAMLTSYDQITAEIIDEAGIPVILVGDSAGNNFYGYENTIPVTEDELISSSRAVVSSTKNALVVSDFPFGSYESSPEQALATGVRFFKEAGPQAVKLEGGAKVIPQIKKLIAAGIPVTWAITGGYAAAATSYTNSSGQATLSVYGQKIGAMKVTATAGGVSGSDSTITVTNATTDARTVALDAATYSVTGGTVKRVSATVKDRYGNAVAGLAVSFAFTGIGRFAGGSLTASGTTDASGVAIADIAPLTTEAGTGTLTASYTGGDAATTTLLASDGVSAYPAAVTSAKATVTTTAGAATATTDAATTSKINDIATAVANLSTTVAGLVASLVAQIKDTKAAIADTKDALDKLAAVVAKIQKKVKA